MKLKFLSLAAICLMGGLSSTSHALGGATGADVLQARLGARAVGMGGAFSALGDDLSVALYNPAGLSLVSRPELSFLHFSAIAEISYENFAYAHPLKFGVLGANILLRNQPDINNALAQDNPVAVSDQVFVLSYAGKVSYFLDAIPENLRNIAFGINMKYLHSHLGQYDAGAFAVDLGARYPLDESLSFALSVVNVGTPIQFISVSDPLPAALLGGVARRFELGKSNVFNAAADLEYASAGDMRLHVGGEDWLGKSLALRLGYVLESNTDFGGMTAGLTLRLDQETLLFSFDYAFQPVYYSGFNSFEPQHLFSMSLGF